MGLIVSDSIELENGVMLDNQYVNLYEINVRKMKEGEHLLYAVFHFYVSKDAHKNKKDHIKKDFCTVCATSLENLHEQAYTEFKKRFKTVQNDI